jgi:hypothetical protein
MSIKTSTTTTINLDSSEVKIVPSTEVALSGEHCVSTASLNEIKATRKEYSIVGDAFYAGINSNIAPTWLTDLIDDVIINHVANGLTDYDLLVQDVRNAIDALDAAKNTFEDNISFQIRVDSVIGTRITTLNASFENAQSQITDLNLVVANNDEAIALRVTDLDATLTEDISSRITIVNNAIASLDSTTANSITSLTTAFTDQESNLTGTANAVTGLQNYVGIDQASLNPNGLGMLSRLSTLEKQGDGAVILTSNTYDVMEGVTDPNTNLDDDHLRIDALPYVLWTNLESAGVPVSTTRPYTDYTLEVPDEAQIDISEGTLYVRSDVTDVNIDKYYKFTGGLWVVITELEYTGTRYSARNNSIGDVYIHYSNTEGTRNYLRSYKFIKTTVDATSPFSTDSGGYGWALVADTDSQSIYMTALQARDMADGKISHFYAWGDGPGGIEPTTYVVTIDEAEYNTDTDGNYLDVNGDVTTIPGNYVQSLAAVTETVVADFVALWFTGGVLYKKGNDWTDKTPMSTTVGTGLYVSVGDMLTVLDPINSDTSTYWFNGNSWQINGPDGIISKSRWFVDLDNAVNSKHGHVASSINELSITSKAYADDKTLSVENKFAYNSTIQLSDGYYKSGFGLDSSGVSNVGNDGLTEGTAFDSEFWVNAKRFVLKNPDFPGVEARFTVTNTGLTLGTEYTEATRNTPAGTHVQSNPYIKGDVVEVAGSSYTAKQNVPSNTSITNTSYWQILALAGTDGDKGDKGDTGNNGDSYTGTTEYYKLTNSNTVPTIASGSWLTTPQTPTSTNRYLWNYNKNTRTIGADINSPVSLITQYVKDGKGISSISEEYQLGTSATSAPTGAWSSTFALAGAISEALPYMWNRTTVVYTEGANSVVITMIAARGAGTPGVRGTAVLTWKINVTDLDPASNARISAIAGYWNSAASVNYDEEVNGDTLILTNTNVPNGWTHIYEYKNGAWVSSVAFTVNGNQVVTGTLAASALVANSITGNQLDILNDITIGGNSTVQGTGVFENGFIAEKDSSYVTVGTAPPSYLGVIFNAPNSAELGAYNGAAFGKVTAASTGITLSSSSVVHVDSLNILLGRDPEFGPIQSTTVTVTGNITASEFELSSDRKVKTNIVKIENALDKLDYLEGCTFDRTDTNRKNRAGIIAQDAKKALPQSVSEVDNILRVDPLALIGLLVEAVKELKKEVRTPWYKRLFK